ncbi:hypothetical protein SPRG_07109 [Saprolegnia parasitica CBS 223.65]|uniref:Glucose-6-phosphate dehydrogenase NAD-binding domain-containing protein n=1 Tax=Saprolegnia parasitica (strain CBS 223.65) TaxID=695850 RepID=A0A067CMS6_SAPPC|nr:hypothetical protein SPRG_07109 [Saprolegnia parasitica CBS 223.65]KDO27836.1 hypothetical protein SPRG_07109 [Saprolegnia parasitica CBS 223.65]|eukprot:XP_012201296.1 hypothetical protein SPRG_07109 [Saprolegnia parasitica CBS 223.65]
MRCLLVAVVVAASCCWPSTDARTQVLVIGGTGNLAQKYLWPAFEALHARHDIELWAAGTDPPAVAAQRLASIRPPSLPLHYAQLSTAADYAALAARPEWHQDAGLVVYLAIPPTYFQATCAFIHAHLCHAGRPWLRVVIEKPFGRDVASARALAAALAIDFDASELFLIDHYLGKASVRGLDAFVSANAHWWSLRAASHLGIHMRETETCEGRTAFFNSVGIVRDVMVNHLTVLLLHAAGASTEDDRRAVTQSLMLQEVVHGQYESYVRHANMTQSTTATAAAVHFAHAPSTSIGISAAKAVADRSTTMTWHARDVPNCIVRIVLQKGRDEGIVIDVCADIAPQVKLPIGWVWLSPMRLAPASTRHDSAYTFLVDAILRGDRRYFMSVGDILHAWALWMPVLDQSAVPRVYTDATTDDGFLHLSRPRALHDDL